MNLQTLYNFFPIEKVQTTSLDNFEKVQFLVNEYKQNDLNSNESILGFNDFNPIEEFYSKKRLDQKENDLGKALFYENKINNTYYTKTQKWIGHVEEVKENGFTAILKDISNGGTDEYGEFTFDEITPDDLSFISRGAAFYMNIGFVSKNGTRKKESEIRFQRLGDFDINEINNQGLDISNIFINHFK